MVWYRVNKPQRYIKRPKEAIIKAKRIRILRAIKPTIKGVKAKPRILVKENI